MPTGASGGSSGAPALRAALLLTTWWAGSRCPGSPKQEREQAAGWLGSNTTVPQGWRPPRGQGQPGLESHPRTGGHSTSPPIKGCKTGARPRAREGKDPVTSLSCFRKGQSVLSRSGSGQSEEEGRRDTPRPELENGHHRAGSQATTCQVTHLQCPGQRPPLRHLLPHMPLSEQRPPGQQQGVPLTPLPCPAPCPQDRPSPPTGSQATASSGQQGPGSLRHRQGPPSA